MPFDKFELETHALGIALKPEEYRILLKLYEDRSQFDFNRSMPSINYDHALRSIVPVLTKNGDRRIQQVGGAQGFTISWTLTQQTKTKA